jgi:peptide chain release factor 3
MLVSEAAKPFDVQSFLEGHMTPVFFGSALRHFGVAELLAGIGAYAPPPHPARASKAGAETHVAPGDNEVSGFVFKVQANMDPNHRDRIAFLRLTSGRFTRGMKLKAQNTGKAMSVNAPVMFFASDRELAEDAFAGDVIGIPNHGVLRVGDSLSETGLLRFAGLPNFAPEILRRVRVKDPLKAKHLKKALEGLAEEGVTQLFRPMLGSSDFIVGAVGQLQFEVMADRLGGEYQLDVIFEPVALRRGPLDLRRPRRPRGLPGQAQDGHGHRHRRPAGVPGQVVLGDRLRRRTLSEGALRADLFPLLFGRGAHDAGRGRGALLRLFMDPLGRYHALQRVC